METENSDDQWRDEDIKDIKPSITTVNDDSATVLNDDEDAMTSPPTTQRQRDVVDVVVDAVAENNNSKEAASSSPLDGALLAVAAAIASSSSNRMSISELIRTLTQPEAGLFPLGVAPKDLFEFMCRLPDDQRITKTRNHLQVLLWRDVKLGKICRLGVGLYTVPEFYQDKIGAEPCLTDNDEENNNGKKDGEEQKRKSPLNKKQNKKKIKAALKNVISCFDTSSSFSLSDDIASSNTSTDTADIKSLESNHRNHDDPSTPESRLQSVIEAVSTKMEIWRYVVNETVDEQHQEFKAIKREREENVEKVDVKKKRKKKRRQSDVDVTGAADPTSAVSVDPDTFLSQSSHQRGVTDNFQRKAEIGLVSSSTSSTTAVADSSKSKKKVNDFMQIYTKKMKKQSSLDAVSTSSYTGATTTADGESCFFCQMPGTQNIFGEPEAFVRCKDCTFKAHPSCLGYTAELADRCRAYPWQCFECKVCSRCMSSENPELMLMCDSCDRSYHMKCHSPVVESKPPQNDKWICSECLLEFRKKHQQPAPIKNNKKAKNAGNLNDLAVEKRYGQIRDTVNAVSIADLTKETEKLDAQMDKFTLPAIEDNPLIKQAAAEAKVWTVEQVFSFISQLGFPEQANAFKREEIDGQALLLLKRNDVLSMLSLKLGPALKIYRRLAVLQSMVCGCDINELEDK